MPSSEKEIAKLFLFQLGERLRSDSFIRLSDRCGPLRNTASVTFPRLRCHDLTFLSPNPSRTLSTPIVGRNHLSSCRMLRR